MGGASGAMMMGGAILSGVGAYQQQRAMKDQANAQAELEEEQARQAYGIGRQQQERTFNEAKYVGGQQRAAAAESGIDLSGSIADIQQDSATNADLDIQAIRHNTENEVFNRKFSAKMLKKKARDHGRAAPIAFLSPVFKGAGQVLA